MVTPENIVYKFGGTSMAQPEVVAGIVEERVPAYVVVSASGKKEGVSVKITDSLESMSRKIMRRNRTSAISDRDAIIDRYDDDYNFLGSSLRSELRDRASQIITVENPDFFYNSTRGELVSGLYFAAAIGADIEEQPPVRFHRDGSVDLTRTLADCSDLAHRVSDRPIIIPGFFGYDEHGRTHSLGRGGSDRTPAFIARFLDIDYVNWTDVDGIYSADPRIVGAENARLRHLLSRREVREGANYGSGVLQGGTIVDLGDSSSVVTVKNTFNLEAQGTQVVRDFSEEDRGIGPITSVTGSKNLVDIFIDHRGMASTDGFIADITSRLASVGVSIEYMPMSHDTMSVVGEATKPEKISEVLADITHNVAERTGFVALIGESLRDRRVSRHVMRNAEDILEGAGIEDFVQHPSSGAASVAFILDNCEQVDDAVRELHCLVEVEGV